MKQHFFVIFLSIVMVLTLLPSAAFADNENGNAPTQLWINNVNILKEGNENAVEGASYDPETNTLTLDNVTIDKWNSAFNDYVDDYSTYAMLSGIYANGDLNVKLKGNNKGISSNYFWYTFLISGELSITGSGSLDIFGSCGIQAKKDISISGTGEMTIESETNCINSETGNINIADTMEKIKLIALKGVLCCGNEQGSITIGNKALSDNDSASLEMIIEKGVIQPVSQAAVIVGGIDVSKESVAGVTYDEASNTLTLNNATISSSEEMYKSAIFAAEDLTIILEGTSKITGDDISYGIFAKGDIEIKGSGDLTAKTQRTGIFTSSRLNISDKKSFIHLKVNNGNVISAESLTLCEKDYSKSNILNTSSIIIDQGEAYWVPICIIVNGKDVTDGENVEGVSYDYKTDILTLKNAKITESSGEEYYNSGIYYCGNSLYKCTPTVKLEGENIIKGDNMDYAIYVDNAECRLAGSGSLNASANKNGIFCPSFDITIDDSIKSLCVSAGASAFYASYNYYVNIGENRVKLTDQKVCIESGEVVLQESNGLYELKVGGTDILAGEKMDGVSFDPETSTLTLNNADITADTKFLIKATGDLNIRLIGDNSLLGKENSDNLSAGIYVEAGSLNICGDGTLSLENDLYAQILVDNTLTVRDKVMIAPQTENSGGRIFVGTINIYNNAVLICKYYDADEFNHISGIFIHTGENTGSVKGDVTLFHDLTIPDGVALIISENSSLTVPDRIKLINNGTIIVSGTLFSDQDISGDGALQGSISPIKHQTAATPVEKQDIGTPATGDDFNFVMWTVLMITSVAGILLILFVRRRLC